MSDYNTKVIEDFRAHQGNVGGNFEGSPMLLLTTTGAKSGTPRTTPLVYLADGDRYVIFASKAGAPTNPDWYHNLRAHPRVTVEVGGETFQADASVADAEERDGLFNRQVEVMPGFADYQRATSRIIPAVILTRV
ncbi:MAG TPA: nitroreductase family deazaflavin-dependent oxidoreductase [Acidimicrobiales bacterium]|jgi:deazaflavin-dependent oxidoreductase (nitroreductase family)|nr:nitroreductase family deazaflavin-dependent oxidoreductase [Acidimicrobiales bacterium]